VDDIQNSEQQMFQKKIVNPIHFYSQIFRVFNTLAVGKL